jgi:hypothetical protein
MLKLTLKDVIKRTVSTVENKVFLPILEKEGLEPVQLQWGEMVLEELDAKARRLSDLAKSGLITPDANLERSIREVEDLPQKEVQ